MNGWTLPLIFAVAGVGLVIVAIVDGGLVIKELTIPSLSKGGRIISGIVGLGFLGLAIYIQQLQPLPAPNGPTATFTYPSASSEIPLKTELKGTVTPATPNRGSYWIVMRDSDGDHYTQARIAASQSGTWTHSIALGPAWKGRPAWALVAFARDEQAADVLDGSANEGLSMLPENVEALATLELRVQQ